MGRNIGIRLSDSLSQAGDVTLEKRRAATRDGSVLLSCLWAQHGTLQLQGVESRTVCKTSSSDRGAGMQEQIAGAGQEPG